MKHWKKLLVVAATVVMAMAMAVPAFADPVTHEVSTESTTHTYQIYQIFTGTVSNGQLQNLKYGANAVGTTGQAVSQTDMTELARIEEKAGKTAAEGGYADDQAKIADLKPFVNLESDPIAEIGKDKESSASLAEGYYIIKDTDGSLSDPETYTLYLFKVLDGNLTITPKSGTTTSDKGITESGSDPVNTGDYDVGSVIPYTLTLTLPDNYADFKEYYAKFVDDMSGGLTLNTDSVKIHYGASDTQGTSITLSAVTGSSYTDPAGQKYEYEIANLKQVAAAANLGAGDTVTITYTATLNSNAVVGEAGNPNKFHVEYSNNPNETGEGHTNNTPDDTNIVFTFETIFNKVDGDNHPLTGADFKLEKMVAENTWVDVTTLNNENGSSPAKTGSTTTTTGQFTFSGLGQGTYRLTETATPTGYNTIAPIVFTIAADYTITAEGAGSITSLTGTGENIQFTSNTSAGTLTSNIVNESGSVLPSTGGMGTTILYIIGGIMVLLAVVFLITKKRVAATKKDAPDDLL